MLESSNIDLLGGTSAFNPNQGRIAGSSTSSYLLGVSSPNDPAANLASDPSVDARRFARIAGIMQPRKPKGIQEISEGMGVEL